MPNLKPLLPAWNKSWRINKLAAVPQGLAFEPLMALYLTDKTTPDTVREAKVKVGIVAFKLYPQVRPPIQIQV